MREHGVVITGVGMVTPLGSSAEECWKHCLRGGSAIAPLRRLDVTGHACTAGAEVDASQLNPSLKAPKNRRFMTTGVLCALQAAQEAVASSGIDLSLFDPYRVSIQTGSGQTGLESAEFFRALSLAWQENTEHDYRLLGGRPSKLINRFFSLRTLSNAGLAFLSMELGAKGQGNNFVHSDTASAMAITTAYHELSENRCDVAIAGGYDSLLNESTYLAYEKAGLLSKLPAEQALRPFDRRRDGIVLGEGAAYLILERAADAKKRDATIMGEIIGLGGFMDTGDSLDMCPSESTLCAAMQEALGSVHPDFVVAHGISTPAADQAEARALQSVIDSATPVTALKAQTGYLGAATAAVELVFALYSQRNGVIPPIAHHADPDADCRLDLVAGQARPCKGNQLTALCVSGSWGGQSSTVLIRASRTQSLSV